MLYFYDFLKILHFLFASILCITLIEDIYRWAKNPQASIPFLHKHLFRIIIPFSLLQLLMGFTMISLKHYNFHEKWVMVSVIGFPIFIASWLLFVYFSTCLLRRQSLAMLGFAMLSLLFMIFFMTNKIL